jgi:murein DD-endopeptidase MepM/ murein hydrolase activator NlpD
MRRRRRRFLRDDVLAPWVTIGVILGVWWLGAGLVRPDIVPALPALPPLSTEAVAPVVRAAPVSPDIPVPADRPMPAPADAVPAVTAGGGEVGELLAKRLLIPVQGLNAASLRSTFTEARGGGRRHEAIDILAARGTPVVAALDGRIVKLFTSAAGGLTIYQYDMDEAYCYYYAHLDSYASDLTEGQPVRRGQTIGYVGTTGNAPPGTPHLHFAIFKLNADKRWWEGAAIDPYLVLR